MKIQSVYDSSFLKYGTVLKGYDFKPLLRALENATESPLDKTIYVPSDAALETLQIFEELSEGFYGGMPIQIGYCNGSNHMLNCFEYHRGSEVNVAANDIVLLLATLQEMKDGVIDSAAAQAFLVPAGTAVQLYETTLHYAPCNAPGTDSFRVAVVLPKGTNEEISQKPNKAPEDRLLWARNKWLTAHPDSAEASQGAFVGIRGENLSVK
jgi:hypothetical protein